MGRFVCRGSWGVYNPTDPGFRCPLCLPELPAQKRRNPQLEGSPWRSAGPTPSFYIIILMMIAPNGSNSQKTFTSGLPLMCAPEPSGLAGLMGPLLFSSLWG